jgi:hypothetical protein
MATESTNTLGLDFTSTTQTTTMQTEQEPEQQELHTDSVDDASKPPIEPPAERPKASRPEPYVNPERVNTGGPPRVIPILLVITPASYYCTRLN